MISKINKRIIVIVILIVSIFLLLNLTDGSKKIKGFFYNLSVPIQKTFWQVGERISGSFKDIENQKLKEENQHLLSQIVFLEDLKQENIFLRQALNLELQKEFQFLLTGTLAKDVGEDFILIDKGSKDGIPKNVSVPVIDSNKVLVGRVWEVYDNSSKVMLISNKNKENDFLVQIKIDEENYLSTEAKGAGNSKIFLELIPKETEISLEDLVITDSSGRTFPENLLVGKVSKVENKDLEPFQKAEVSLFSEIEKFDHLFVIINY